ncbi:glycosyltransferase [Ramlibacter sp. AW1]|uniref:Glycosyltransferase n=1 Tax=Ramlibacter aurantiacus TaxID=2801330 RepID=A0A936ZMI6_9BURK|nr:glycosyltransferase [Ramlibacter aurantiacus]MBL0418916.1 glycosyltransferase [Ramlibacter aurantiacus]
MISVITAVHNQLPMNQLFMQQLKAATRQPYELIIIDNASRDGSGSWLERAGARVIRNQDNLSYPRSQNQGIARARGDWLVFMNNDVIPSPGWDQALLASMREHDLDVATSCGIERIETAAATRALRRRWQRITWMARVFGTSRSQLALMHRLMYPDWKAFCADRQRRFKGQVLNGFVGNTVAMRRAALDKIGLWDERIQAADFDLYLRVAKRRLSHGDIRDVHIVLDCFVHHYIRLTLRGKRTPFADAGQLIPLERKWAAADLALLPTLEEELP